MKRIITSASLVALGAASVHAAHAPGLSPTETSKPWSVSATLRGFYDSNYVTSPNEQDSFGYEVSPSAGLNFSLDQTYIGLSYVYGLRYYEDREPKKRDHTHQANFKLSHAFTERVRMDVADSFVIAQEPEVLDPEGATRTTLLRSEGDNLRNTAKGTLTVDMTDQLTSVLSYQNTIYNYEQSGIPASRSAFLDRMEQLVRANLRWTIVPSTVGVLGYDYERTDYTSDDPLRGGGPPLGVSLANWAELNDPEARNSQSHAVYVGADHTFNQALSASARVGAQYTIYEEVPLIDNDDVISPYVDANLMWTYLQNAYLQVGVRHSRTRTDLAYFPGFGGVVDLTMDAETTALYASWNHPLTARIEANALALAQRSDFEGGLADGETENMLLTGLNLAYKINEFLKAETGYNFDRLDSDIPARSFTRHRVFVGLRATY